MVLCYCREWLPALVSRPPPSEHISRRGPCPAHARVLALRELTYVYGHRLDVSQRILKPITMTRMMDGQSDTQCASACRRWNAYGC